MAETTEQSATQNDEVLSLHRGVLARWADSPIAAHAERSLSIGSGATGLLDGLTALTGLGAGFSTEAFEIASMIALEPRLAQSLGAEVRALAVGDLADLVQVVLEEEEAALEEATRSLRSDGRAPRRAAAAKATESKQATAPRKAAPAQSRRLAAVRKALTEVRQRAAEVAARRAASASEGAERTTVRQSGATADVGALSGAARSDRAGDLGTVDPGLSSFDVTLTARPSLRASARLLREDGVAPLASIDAQRLVGSVSDVSVEAMPTRALRLAEGEAEMAMLAPLADLPDLAFDAKQERWVAAPKAAPASTMAAPAAAATATPAAIAASAPSQRVVQAALQARLQTRNLQAAPRMVRRDLASQTARPLTTTAPAGTTAAPAQRQTSGLLALREAATTLAPTTPAGAAPIGGVDAPRSATTVSAQAPASAASWTALQGAVSSASALIARVERGVAAHPAFRAPAEQAPGARWSQWLDDTAAAGRAEAAEPALGFAGRERVAALGDELGAGEWLALAQEIEIAAPVDATRSTTDAAPGKAPRTSAGTPTAAAPIAATPRWLTERAPLQTVATQPTRATQGVASLPAAAAITRPTAAAIQPGVTAVATLAQATRLTDRLFAGVGAAPQTASTSPTSIAGALAAPMMPSLGLDGFAAESGNEMLSHLRAAGSVSPMQGGLAFDAGAGEWLVPGEDAPVPVDAEGRPTGPRAAQATQRQQRVAQQARQPMAIQRAAQDTQRQGVATPASNSPMAAAAAPMAVATQAAVSAVLARFDRGLDQAVDRQLGQGAVAFALQSSGVLGLLNDGNADALTPILAAHAAERLGRAATATRPMAAFDGGAGAMLDLGEELAIDPAQPAAADRGAAAATARTERSAAATTGPTARPAATVATRAAQQDAAVRSARTRLERSLARAGAGAAAPTLAAAMLSGREPAALRAALSLFGDASTAPSADVASRFFARWIGAPEPRTSRVANQAADAVTLQPGMETAQTLRPTALAADAAEAAGKAATPKSEKVVFEGLAGLAALREMKGAGEVDGALLALGKVESTETVAPAAAGSATAKAGDTAAPKAATPRGGRASTAVRSHRFAPVGLARSRHLLGGKRGSEGAVRSVSRGTRVGYGSAALGGGALLGLGPGEADAGFFGTTYQSPAASMRAERLGEQIRARRSADGHTAPGRTMPAGGSERTMVRPLADTPYSGPAVRPLPSDGASLDLVSPAAIAASVAAGQGAAAGATAADRSGKAASMARVLSVTAAPTSNVLPLVAPAAKAVVAKAAAKPQSESIATSGSNPTYGVPLAGQGMESGGGGAGSGKGGTAEERSQAGGGPQQELDALAMKIARSVLVRIKRERERRGIHV
ncbi:MAG: hypothetical protein H6747_08850 [Deltaproteobacteria bacterium]|nr:hypothetical protein [Deltaproteobacteria bacterium]